MMWPHRLSTGFICKQHEMIINPVISPIGSFSLMASHIILIKITAVVIRALEMCDFNIRTLTQNDHLVAILSFQM